MIVKRQKMSILFNKLLRIQKRDEKRNPNWNKKVGGRKERKSEKRRNKERRKGGMK